MASIRLIETRGASLEVYQRGDGDKLALCLHGFPEHAISWRYQQATFVSAGYTVWTPNLRGYGRSTRPVDPSQYHLDYLLDDIKCLVDAAGKREVLLVGHDWGALLAWLFVLHDIRPVNRLITMSIYHPALLSSLTSWRQVIRSLYLPLILMPGPGELSAETMNQRFIQSLIQMIARSTGTNRETLKVYLNNISKPGALTAMANYYRANVNPAIWASDNLKKVTGIPVMMINGSSDPWIGPEMLTDMDKLATNLTTHLLQGASHWPHIEQASKVNRLLLNWLESPPPTRVA